MNLIVAADENWAIGNKNELLVRIPADQKFFRETTMGKVVVMGRKTLETFPNGLPLMGRTNIVLTHDKKFRVPGALIVHDMEELHEELEKYNSEDIYVIGGESVYRQLIDECDVAHVTKIDFAYDADAHFPDLDADPAWEITADSEEQTYFDLEYYFYRINVTFPIFLVMVIGYFLKQIGMLNDNFVTVANRFNFKVTLPFMLFRDIAGVDIRAVFDLKYVLFCALVSTACFWMIWGGVKLFLKDQTMRGAFVQASFRSSAAVMGLAFIQNIYGTSAMGPLMIVSAVPLYNIFSVIVLTFEGENASGVDGKQKIKEACIGIAKNPIILGILAGLIVGLLGIEFPTIINKTVNSVAQMATPLALITIGAGFEGRKALAKIKPTIAASLIKLVIQPLIFLPVAVWMGFGGEKMIAILIMLASPTTPSCYIMAKSMNNDGVLTASVIVTTTLLAAFTLTGWIFILKSVGLIG